MKLGRRTPFVALAATLLATLAATVAHASMAEAARGSGGVQLTLPASWSKLTPARDRVEDPRTLLVIGTAGSRAIESDCQVSSYRVPADGAVVVVTGWRSSVGGGSYLPPLSALRLRRGTFDCFAGRGAVASVTRREHDFQISVMVGDKADAATIAAALESARSFSLALRA